MGPLRVGVIPDGSTVALDTFALICFLERHPRHFDAARALFQRVESGESTGLMSSLMSAELLVPADQVGDDARAGSLLRLLSDFPNLHIVPSSTEISAEAARLPADRGLRTPDAIHLATALGSNADGVVTNDRQWLCVKGTLPVWLFDA